ncbi:MAG: hypothetical protein J5779_00825 [Clostridia bacterium]|nr:hypothetical protein [Clostridia bacterium]
MNKKQKIALVFNIAIFLLVVVGCVLCFNVKSDPLGHAIKVLNYFTIQSNIFAGITSFVYIIFLVRANKSNKKIPKAVCILRYIATIDLILTFLVVTLFFGFIAEKGYLSMFENANLFFHLIIPVTNFVSFVFFENELKFKISYTLFGLIHVVIYCIYYIIVYLSHYENGEVPEKYDWYYLTKFGIGWAFVIAIVTVAIGYLISFVLYKTKNRIIQKES